MSNKKLNKAISKMSMNTIGKALKKLNLPIVSNCDHKGEYKWHCDSGVLSKKCKQCGKLFI